MRIRAERLYAEETPPKLEVWLLEFRGVPEEFERGDLPTPECLQEALGGESNIVWAEPHIAQPSIVTKLTAPNGDYLVRTVVTIAQI